MSEPQLGRIEPDTKDWTWVLQRPCPECGMAAGAIVAAEVPGRPDVAARPEPTVWSPLEYGCHVRDVCRLMQWRAELMLTEDFPTFPDWDQDATALAEHYAEQDPARVAHQLRAAAHDAAATFAGVTGDQWRR